MIEDQTTKDRLLAKVRIDGVSGCWEWTASKFWRGYGQIRADGTMKYAHRVSFELHCGEIPEGMCVCHRCDNRGCVNPEHLFLGTHQENMADMVAKRRQGRGEYLPQSKLTEINVIAIRSATGSLREMAELFGVSRSVVSRVRGGKLWGHVGIGEAAG